MEKRFKLTKDYFYYILIALAFLVVLLRSFYGFDWSDETYYIALPYRFVLGDSMFQHSWDIHQLSSLIIVPFVWMYKMIVGSTDGIILFFRILYSLAQFGVGIIIFTALKKYYNKTALALCSIIFIIFAPSSIGNMSYNTMSLQFFCIALVLFVNILNSEKNNKVIAILCGVSYALAVQCYPYLIITLPVAVIGLCIRYVRANVEIRRVLLKKILFIVMGILIVVTVFVLFVLWNSSLDNLFNNFKYILSDPEHKSRSLIEPINDYYMSIQEVYGQLFGIVIIMWIISFILGFIKNNKLISTMKIIIFSVGLFLLFKVIGLTLATEEANIIMINYLCIPLTLIGPIFCLLSHKKNSSLFYTFWIGGILYSIAIQYGTNNGLFVSSYGFIISLIGVIICIFESVFNIAKEIKLNQYIKMLLVAACIIVVAIQGVLFLKYRIITVYRDSEITLLTEKLKTGPAKGIYTSKDRYEKYETIIGDITNNIVKEGTVFYTKLLPFGYLCSDLTPATPSLWRTEFNSIRLKDFYKNNPEKLPKMIFVVNEEYGITNDNNKIEGILLDYINHGDFEKKQVKSGIIYIAR